MTIEGFHLFTSDQVLTSLFGEKPPVTRKQLEKVARQYGCFTDFSGHMVFSPKNIGELISRMQATPEDDGEGPARLLTSPRRKDTAGYVVFIGDQIDPDAPVYIGWAPSDAHGASDLLSLVQFGNPSPQAILLWVAGTPGDADQIRQVVDASRMPNVEGWYVRSEDVVELMQSARAGTPEQWRRPRNEHAVL